MMKKNRNRGKFGKARKRKPMQGKGIFSASPTKLDITRKQYDAFAEVSDRHLNNNL